MIRKATKVTMTALAAAAALMFAVPVLADEAADTAPAEAAETTEAAEEDTSYTFTSEDGVLSLEMPSDEWKVVEDPNKWVALSDGANVVSIEHYSNGEKLPDITVADDHYVKVYQAAVSTQNEVFILTGKVTNADDIQEVFDIIVSAKVLKYDTKQAVKKETANINQFSLRALNTTMYTTANVNIRSGCSTDDQILGGVGAGQALQVTGAVQKDGKDYGWYQVVYNGGTGYVSASFMTDKAPSSKSAISSITFTSNAKTVYDANGNAVTVYEATDGAWYDSNGYKYYWADDYTFKRTDGALYSINQPSAGRYPIGSTFTAYWASGAGENLSLYSDGYFYTVGDMRYRDGGDGCYYGDDGTVLYNYDPTQNQYDDDGYVDGEEYEDDANETHFLVRQEDGWEVIVSAGGGAYYDDDGTEYSWTSDSTMMDFYGHTYDVRW